MPPPRPAARRRPAAPPFPVAQSAQTPSASARDRTNEKLGPPSPNRRGSAKERDNDRETIWREAAQSAGLDGDIRAALQQRSVQAFATDDPERVFAERLATLPAQLTEHESVIDRRELVRSVHAASVGLGLPLSRLDQEVGQLVSSGAFVEIGRDAIGQARYSTPEMIAIERDLVATASRLAEQRGAGIDPADIKARSAAGGLSAEQTFAAEAATGPNAIVVIEGAPGSGKTRTLAPIVEAYSVGASRHRHGHRLACRPCPPAGPEHRSAGHRVLGRTRQEGRALP